MRYERVAAGDLYGRIGGGWKFVKRSSGADSRPE